MVNNKLSLGVELARLPSVANSASATANASTGGAIRAMTCNPDPAESGRIYSHNQLVELGQLIGRNRDGQHVQRIECAEPCCSGTIADLHEQFGVGWRIGGYGKPTGTGAQHDLAS